MKLKKEREWSNQRQSVFSVHPLFLLSAIYYSAVGKGGMFLICTVVALLHEFGHFAVATRLGYRAQKLQLLPCGAVLNVDTLGITVKDEIFLALGGPLLNFCCAVFFVALWWLFPDTYAFTDTACYFSAFLALLNLLPFFPLDGGRILCAILTLWCKRQTSVKICKGITFTGAIALLGLFAFYTWWQKAEWNITILFFAGFLLCGCFASAKNGYKKWNFGFGDGLKRGVEVKRIAVDATCNVRKAVGFLRGDRYLIFDVYDQNQKVAEVTQTQVWQIFEKGNLYSVLYDGKI